MSFLSDNKSHHQNIRSSKQQQAARGPVANTFISENEESKIKII
jgi:hypothetical protein